MLCFLSAQYDLATSGKSPRRILNVIWVFRALQKSHTGLKSTNRSLSWQTPRWVQSAGRPLGQHPAGARPEYEGKNPDANFKSKYQNFMDSIRNQYKKLRHMN